MTYLQNMFRLTTEELMEVFESMSPADNAMVRKANAGSVLARNLYDLTFEEKVEAIIAKRGTPSLVR